jgi:CHAD domain-containing protein
VRAAAEQRRAALAALLAESPGTFEAERLHAVRIGFRWLRYTTELWEALNGHQSEETALLRAQQQQLGQVHDAWILSCWLRARAERAVARGQHELAAAALRLADQNEAQARETHAAWLRSHPRELLEGLRVAWREAAEPPQPTED